MTGHKSKWEQLKVASLAVNSVTVVLDLTVSYIADWWMWHSTSSHLVTRPYCFTQVNLFGLKPVHLLMMIGIWVLYICRLCKSVVCAAVYPMISRRRFQQLEVLEGQNILVTISGKKNKIRVYYLSWLKTKILKTDVVGLRSLLALLHVSCMSIWHGSLFLWTR